MAERGLDLAKQLDGRSAAKPPEVAPNDADAYINRGRAYHQLSQYDKAIADYTEAIRIDPDYADAYYNRGRAHRELGNLVKAKADFARAKELGYEPDDE